MAGCDVRIKRIYEPADASDGVRVLVDRLWPRGVAREGSGIDEWLRDVAPSDALRRWYGHEPERQPEFRRRYLEELAAGPAADALGRLKDVAGGTRTLTLLTATRTPDISHAAVLRDLLLT
jgi:uncharacterized protein YeaO (DUF488 family)